MTCVHEDDVIGVNGDMNMFPLSTFTSVSWLGILCVCALGVQEGGVISLVLRARCLVEVSGGELSCFMIAKGRSSQCLVQ